MKQDLLSPPAQNDPASAFEDLRGEVSLLRRALEGLTAERKAAPDYTPTLAEQARRLAGIEEALEGFAQSPALKLTPRSLTDDIIFAARATRADDRATLQRAIADISATIVKFDGTVRRARTVDQQRSMLTGMMLAALYVGFYGGLVLGWTSRDGAELAQQASKGQSTSKPSTIGPRASKAPGEQKGKPQGKERERSGSRSPRS